MSRRIALIASLIVLVLAGTAVAQTADGPAPAYGLGTVHVAFAVAVVLAVAGLAVWKHLDVRERALDAAPEDEEVAVDPGIEGFVRVHVKNRTDLPVNVEFTVQEAPSDWKVGAARSELRLDPNAQEAVWVSVTPPAEAAAGTSETLVLQARNARARFRAEEIRFRAQIGSP